MALIVSALIFTLLQGVLATPDTCFAFGDGEIGIRSPCGPLSGNTTPFMGSVKTPAQVLWALTVPGIGKVFTMSDNSLVFWDGIDAKGFTVVPLAPMATPVGAVHLGGKIYVACFGTGPNGDSGLAVVDIESRTLEATYVYRDARKHVHNVYAVDWGDAKEIFVAVLGNPWATRPLAGDGLVRFDRSALKFLPPAPGMAGSLSVRSAKQESASVFYVLTQEPAGNQTKLARLERQGNNGELAVAGTPTLLPSRSGGDGGADVLLGPTAGSVFATDRISGGGKIYYYVWDSGAFHQMAEHNTGNNPRYTVALLGGDILSCDQDNATLTVFGKLFQEPIATDIVITTIPTVATPNFFLEDQAGAARVVPGGSVRRLRGVAEPLKGDMGVNALYDLRLGGLA